MEIQILVYNEDEKIYEKELANSFEEAEDILAKLKRVYSSDTAEKIFSNTPHREQTFIPDIIVCFV